MSPRDAAAPRRRAGRFTAGAGFPGAFLPSGQARKGSSR